MKLFISYALRALTVAERKLLRRPRKSAPAVPRHAAPPEDAPPSAASQEAALETQTRQREIERRPQARKRARVPELLPPPFAWIEIPAGQVTLVPDGYDKEESYLKHATIFDVAAFAIAKYPITNAQYALFVEAGGYHERRWWTEAGWRTREEGWAWNSQKGTSEPTGNPWTEPTYWQDAEWNGADHPVVGVSWYEAMAFCRWLSEVSGEEVTLPSEQQWQRAAQGDDGRTFPWGDTWDSSRCNAGENGAGHTTSVYKYEEHGDSPFGAVDMAGNVWEWCLTAYETGDDTPEGDAHRVVRGGSWFIHQYYTRAAFRFWFNPSFCYIFVGFRVVRPPSL